MSDTSTFKFQSLIGAELFRGRLAKRAYEQSADLKPPGSYRVDTVGEELHIVVHPMNALDLATLHKLATDDRRTAGEPPARRGPPPKTPPTPAAPKSEMKKRAARAAKADVDRKDARRAALEPPARQSRAKSKPDRLSSSPTPSLTDRVAQLEARELALAAELEETRSLLASYRVVIAHLEREKAA